MKVVNCEQGSPEWYAVRVGIPTASNFDKLLTARGEQSKQMEKYLYTIAAEKVSGIKSEIFQTPAMLHGIETEAEAVQFYELSTGQETETVGFCLDDSGLFGCSPDRLIGDKGLLEVKCPQPQTQVAYLLSPEDLERDYFQQVQGQLFITGRLWCDLLSYSRGLKPVIRRIEKDEQFITKLENTLTVFNKQLEQITEKIK